MKTYGLILDTIYDLRDYILGSSAVPYIFYNDTGDWEQYLPRFEKQRTGNNQETSGCTCFGTLSQIETFHKFLYKEEPNYSERFTYNLIPIDPSKSGTDPVNAHECVRKRGCIDEKLLPMTDSLAQYTDKSRITGSLLAKGLNWLETYDYKHEWVWKPDERPTNYIDVLREALKTSPIAISVYAWNEVNGVYVSSGDVNNHYCLLYKIDDEEYPWIFDTYDSSKKKLSKDHNIRRAKRIWLNKKTPSAMKKHIGILTLILNKLMGKQTFLEVCESAIGTDVTPTDRTPDEVACAEVVSTLIRKVEPAMPIITGTATLWEYLDNPIHGFRQVQDPQAGDIIISPTGYGLKGTSGHVGVVLQDNVIASNTSFGTYAGKFMKNHTIQTWAKYYVEKRNYPVYYYRKMV